MTDFSVKDSLYESKYQSYTKPFFSATTTIVPRRAIRQMNIAMNRPFNGFGSGSNRMNGGGGYLPTPPYTPPGRQHQNQGNAGGHRGKSMRNRAEFQFWPQAIAMGSLVGKSDSNKRFTQMLGAGCHYGEDTSKRYKNGEPTGDGISYLAFDFTMEFLVVRAKLMLNTEAIPPALRPLDAEISFDDITAGGISIVEERLNKFGQTGWEVTVTVSCKRPPRFYSEFENSHDLKHAKSENRRRATAMDFALTNLTEIQAGPLQAIPEGPCAYPTFWNTYRWVFHLNEVQLAKLRACASKLRLLAEEDPQINLIARGKPHWKKEEVTPAMLERMYRLPDLSKIRFRTRTLIEGLIGLGTLKPGEVPELMRALQQHAIAPAFQERLLESLFMLKEDRIKDVNRVVAGKARFLRKEEPLQLSHLVMIRNVLVTPTRVLIGPPQQEPSNSVTRRYADKLDGIARVTFTDEEDRLFAGDSTKEYDIIRPDVGIMARVRRALQHGIFIGGEKFFPVASSASQQKDRSIWFINPKVIDGQALRSWMGNVAETIVAKHAARMGLPFSTSRIVDIDAQMGPMMPDIERNGYTFTDGVGFAGRAVLAEAARALSHHRGINSQPSAIQFRLGGAKGVLTCWPKIVGDHEIRLRPSMVKFESQLKDLNVVRIAKYQGAFLNRQFINIMCPNGIPEHLFVEIFKQTVNKIKGLSGRVQNGTYTPDDLQLFSTTEFPLARIIKAGYNNNPMILDMVDIIECRALQDLKWKARLKIAGGVFMIGVADETGILKEGEVFCQFQQDDEHQPRVVVSEVLVCRAPALHPGDVQRAFAVDRPELRHLKNVIVFSTQGRRDLPNMLGGGDLDGDDFTLIWDQRFVQPLKPYEPMNYTAPPPLRVERVTQSDLNENFVQYLLNDVLGFVDNAHLALSDSKEKGPFDPMCLELSEIHSTAVDFAKTGQAAKFSMDLKPRSWPSFMDNEGKKQYVYESQKILGQLFRLVQPEPHFRPRDLKRLGYPVDKVVSRFPIYHSLLEALRPIKAQYEQGMQHDMRQYRVFEPEIPAGIALRNKRRKRAKQTELTEPLRDSYTVHVKGARLACLNAIDGLGVGFKTSLSKEQVVARHCYALTFEKEYVEEWESQLKAGQWYSEVEDEGDDLRILPMTSFGWIFLEQLESLAKIPLVKQEPI